MPFGIESEDARHVYRDAERLEFRETGRLDDDLLVIGPDGVLDRFEAKAVNAVSIPIGEDIVDLKVTWCGLKCRGPHCTTCANSYEEMWHHLVLSRGHNYNTRTETTCKHCGKTFEYRERPSESIKRGTFCSEACQGEYLSVDPEEVECHRCGETFEAPKHDNRKYCSVQCSGRDNLPHLAD